MTYVETRAWLDSLGEFHMAFGLDRVRGVLGSLGDPQDCAPAIHVAGTNGKGATCAFAASILRHAGKKVGLYTSPHLSRPNERVAIAGRPIADDAFADALSAVRVAGGELTFFETLTAAAFVAFRDARVDAMVVEVGLGGRLDATNVIDAPAATVVTSVSLDHTHILGTTVEAIAAEKAGIVKPRTPVVCAARDPKVIAVVEEKARAADSSMLLLDRDFRCLEKKRGGFTIDSDEPFERVVRDCSLPLDRAFLRDDAAAAALAAHILDPEIADDAIRDGLAGAVWPGRGESLQAGDTAVLLDGAHNPEAAARLVETRFPHPPTIVIAMMRDKDMRGVLTTLARWSPHAVVCTSAGTERSATAAELAEIATAVLPFSTVLAVDSVDAAFDRAVALAGRTTVVVTGSLYVVGRVRERIAGPVEALG